LTIIICSLPGFFYRVYKKKPGKIFECLYNFSFYALVNLVVVYIYLKSPTKIGERYSRVILMIAGFTFAKLKTLIQMSHVSKTEYQQFRRSNLIVLGALALNTFSGHMLGECLIDEATLLYIALFFTLFLHIHLLGNIIIQFCDVLKIRAFRVKPIKYERF